MQKPINSLRSVWIWLSIVPALSAQAVFLVVSDMSDEFNARTVSIFVIFSSGKSNESQHDKINQITCAPSLIRVFAVHMKKHCGPHLPTERTAKTDQTGRMPRLI